MTLQNSRIHGSRKRFFLAVCFIIVFLIGCATVEPHAPVEITDPGSLLEKSKLAWMSGEVFRSRATVRVDSPEGTYTTRVAVIMSAPCFLRLETVPLIGTPDFIMVLNRKDMHAFFIRKGKFYIGPANVGLSLFLPVYLTPTEVVCVLAGKVPPLPAMMDISLKGFFEDGSYRIDIYIGGKKTRSIWINTSGKLLKLELTDSGGSVYEIYYSDYKRVGRDSVPGSIEIKAGSDKTIKIDHGDMELSPGGETENLFNLDVPSGIEPIYIR